MPISTQSDLTAMETETAPFRASLGPLPGGWEQITDQSETRCFRNHDTHSTTYYDPRQPNRHRDGFAPRSIDGAPLPSGWKPGVNLVGRYFS